MPPAPACLAALAHRGRRSICPEMTCSVQTTLLASHVVACPTARCQWAGTGSRQRRWRQSGPQSRLLVDVPSRPQRPGHVPLFLPSRGGEEGGGIRMQEKLREKVLEERAKKRARGGALCHLPAASLTAKGGWRCDLAACALRSAAGCAVMACRIAARSVTSLHGTLIM